jgi:hypothetical protein
LTDRVVASTLSSLPVALAVVVPLVIVLAMVHAVLVDAQLQGQVVGLVLLGALVWWLWQKLPGVVRTGVKGLGRWAVRGRTRRDRH